MKYNIYVGGDTLLMCSPGGYTMFHVEHFVILPPECSTRNTLEV
jgi:hypothetical protein